MTSFFRSIAFLACVLSYSSLFSDTLAVCCIFRDEAKYLPEWIEFHQTRGVKHFFLYNNLSIDNYKETLDPYLRKGLVEIIDWPHQCKDGEDWDKIYCAAYMDCAKKCINRYTWCAFLDTDEYLFTLDGTPLNKFFARYRAYPAVVANWVFYGTSNVEKIPAGEKLVDHLVWRAPLNFRENQGFKIIAQPRHIISCHNAHYFIFAGGQIAVDELYRRKEGDLLTTISADKIRINHYWSRDKEFFFNVKLPRRNHFYADNDRDILLESQMNEVFDPILAG